MIARMLLLDEVLFRRIGAFRPAWMVRAMRALTHLGDAPSWICIGLFLLAGQGNALGALALGLATAIAISRVYLGAHFPLDVTAGAILGCGCGALARVLVGA